MTAEILTKTFKYSFPTCTNEEVLFKLEVPVEIPHAGCPRELVQRLIEMFHIPVYLEDDLNVQLAEFVATETRNFHNERDEKLLNQLKSSEINVEGIVKNWEKLFKENVMEFAELKGTSDEEVFAAAYHKLVHSPALETILQVENSYAKTVTNMLKNRDEDIKKLTERQTEEMEEKMRLLNTSVTEEDINELAGRHFEEQSLVAGRWGSQIDALCQTQRAQHRAWLMDTLDQYQTNSTSALNTPSASPPTTFSPEQLAARPRLEESFTIHLGSQLKQTHNVRIVAMDLLDLCTLDHDNPTEGMRRLQSSLALYSGELAGVVLLAGAPPAAALPLQQLQRAAAAAPDHHFPPLDVQLRDIHDRVQQPAMQRNEQRAQEASARTGGDPPGGGAARGGGGGRGAAYGGRVRDAAQQPGRRARRLPPRGRRRYTQRRNNVTPPGYPRAAQHSEGGVLQRYHHHLPAAAAAARPLRGAARGVVRAARGAGPEVREGVRAGGGGLGRRRAAHAAVRGAAAHRAARLRRAGAPAAQHLPHLQPRQGQARAALGTALGNEGVEGRSRCEGF